MDHRIVGGCFKMRPMLRSQKFRLDNYFSRSFHVLRYRLEGYDMDWIDVCPQRVARYPRLPPGEFRFHVRAVNHLGLWNLNDESVRFLVLPAWWEQRWFHVFLVLAVLSGAIALHVLRLGVLERARRLQQIFSRRLIEFQERERSRVASELHDGLGQNLLIIKRQAAMVQEIAGLNANHSKRIDAIEEAADLAIEDVHRLARDLRPYELDRLGLSQALEAVAERSRGSQSTQFSVEIDDVDQVFNKAVETHVFRIVQEALTNAAKHSEASKIRLKVSKKKDVVEILVADNGKGLNENQNSDTTGLGHTSMKERALFIGADLRIESSVGEGLKVRLRVPARECMEYRDEH